MWDSARVLTGEDVRSETQVYADLITETINLFLPSHVGSLLYVSSHYEAALCYLLNNSKDSQGSFARYMNFNRPLPKVYFIYSKPKTEITDDEVTSLCRTLRSTPYPVVLDSQMTGAHHRIWRGHGSQRNNNDPVDMKCRDAFGVFPTLAFQLKAWPDSILQTMQARSKSHLFDVEILHELQNLPCYETVDCGETCFAFPEAEVLLLNALPVIYKQSYLMIHMYFSTQFHKEVANISQLLMHVLFWTYEDLSTRVNTSEVTNEVILDHIISKYLLQKTLSNYLVKEQKMQVDLGANFSKVTSSSILSCVDFTLRNQTELREGFTAYLKDRITCTVKLQILRLRKHVCDATLDTCAIKEWLDLNQGNEPNFVLIKKMVSSWELSLKIAAKTKKSKKNLKSYVEESSDAASSEDPGMFNVIIGSMLYKAGDYQKAFNVIEPIVKLCLPSFPDSNTEDLYVSSSMSEPDFLRKTLFVQILSLVMVSDPELVAHPDFITHDETRMSKSPLAGEMPNNITGVFSLPVFIGCLCSLCLWMKYEEENKIGKLQITIVWCRPNSIIIIGIWPLFFSIIQGMQMKI